MRRLAYWIKGSALHQEGNRGFPFLLVIPLCSLLLDSEDLASTYPIMTEAVSRITVSVGSLTSFLGLEAADDLLDTFLHLGDENLPQLGLQIRVEGKLLQHNTD